MPYQLTRLSCLHNQILLYLGIQYLYPIITTKLLHVVSIITISYFPPFWQIFESNMCTYYKRCFLQPLPTSSVFNFIILVFKKRELTNRKIFKKHINVFYYVPQTIVLSTVFLIVKFDAFNWFSISTVHHR